MKFGHQICLVICTGEIGMNSVQRLATVSLKTAITHGIAEFLWWVNQTFLMLLQQTAAAAQWLVALWGL